MLDGCSIAPNVWRKMYFFKEKIYFDDRWQCLNHTRWLISLNTCESCFEQPSDIITIMGHTESNLPYPAGWTTSRRDRRTLDRSSVASPKKKNVYHRGNVLSTVGMFVDRGNILSNVGIFQRPWENFNDREIFDTWEYVNGHGNI